MKTCPTCQSQYTDDTLQFCLQDGTPLQNASNAPMPTVAFGEQETVVSNRRSNQMNTPRETQPTGWQPNQIPLPQEKKSNAATAVFLTAFVMLLFFSLVGIGAWLYFKGGKPDRDANLLLANKSSNMDKATSNRADTATKPTVSATTTPSNANSSPTPPINTEQIKKDVSQRVYSWKSAAESLNLNNYMSHYADTVDYYNKKGASVATVRSDKQRAFTTYDSITITLSNMSITPNTTGESATAVFDKEWVFQGAKYSAGKVRTQLQLKKINGQWLIAGERDLKVYYTQK